MGRVIGMGLFVAILYVALTVYTEGADRAFGGTFGALAPTTEEEAAEVLSNTSAYTRETPGDENTPVMASRMAPSPRISPLPAWIIAPSSSKEDTHPSAPRS